VIGDVAAPTLIVTRAAHRELPCLYHPPYFSATPSACWFSLSQEYGKLLASVAAHHVNLSQLLMKIGETWRKTSSPSQVPEFIIQALN